MASDLLQATERAFVIALKADAPLAELIAETSIAPMVEKPEWPFILPDSAQAILSGRGCTARSEVRFAARTFAKAIHEGDPVLTPPIVTAKDHAARIHSAVVGAVHGHAFMIEGRRYRFSVASSRVAQNSFERDVCQYIANVVARAYVG